MKQVKRKSIIKSGKKNDKKYDKITKKRRNVRKHMTKSDNQK